MDPGGRPLGERALKCRCMPVHCCSRHARHSARDTAAGPRSPSGTSRNRKRVARARWVHTRPPRRQTVARARFHVTAARVYTGRRAARERERAAAVEIAPTAMLFNKSINCGYGPAVGWEFDGWSHSRRSTNTADYLQQVHNLVLDDAQEDVHFVGAVAAVDLHRSPDLEALLVDEPAARPAPHRHVAGGR